MNQGTRQAEGTRQQAQGNSLSTLEDIRTAALYAKEDRDECLRTLRSVIVATQHVETMELFARLQGDIHELDLLRKRELSLLVDGREPEAQQEKTEVTEKTVVDVFLEKFGELQP